MDAVRNAIAHFEHRAMMSSGQRHHDRDRVREPKGQRLGHQLAQDQLHVDDRDADDERGLQGGRDPGGEDRARQDRLEVPAGQVTADDAGQGPHEGDPDLDGGQEPVHVVLEVLDPSRTSAALRDELLDAAPAHRDDRDLAAGEEPVPQQAQEDGGNEQHWCRHGAKGVLMDSR